MPVTVAVEPARTPELLELLRLSDEYAFSLYPPESCYLLDVSELEADGVRVFVARENGIAGGLVALVLQSDGVAEIKRMFVAESARGLGVASALMRELELRAHAERVHTVRLETGPAQPEAIALYKKFGYRIVPNFGPYVGDEFSVCMEKRMEKRL